MKTHKVQNIKVCCSKSYVKRIITALLIMISCIWNASASCIEGFFELSGSCVPCDNSCKDCVNALQCTSCFDNMYLNPATNLCETCAVGQYFDATVNTCRSCDGSCLKGCSYQKNCYVCLTDQYYDLESKACVNSCGANTISVNRQRYQGVPICKSTNIYVDPSSSSIIELGTKSDPYKNLVLAFLDALNIFSHQNVTLNIYVKENTILYVTVGSMYIINTPKVNIAVYTDSGTNPRQSTIVFSDTSVTLMSKRTLFNILSSANVTSASAISNSALTTSEQSALQTKNIGFMINRCNFYMSNFRIITNFASNATSFTLMKAVYLQTKTINITNVDFKIRGNLFDSYDSLSFNMANIDIDYVDSARGFYFQTVCNDTNSSAINEINFANIKVYNSQERTVNMIGSLISFAGAANFTLSDSLISIYGSLTNPYPPIQFLSTSSCNPNDGVSQIFSIQRTTFNLVQDSTNSKFVQVYSSIDNSYLRTLTINYNSLVFNGIVMSSQPLLKFYANQNTNVLVGNISLNGATFQDDIIHISSAGYINLDSITFKNITKLGDQLIHMYNSNKAILSNFVIDGCTLSSVDKMYYILHRSDVGSLNITGLVFKNTDVKSRTAVHAIGVPSLIVSNSTFQSSTISSDNSLIRTGVVSELNFNGVNFTQIKSSVPGDNTNYLFDYDSLDLSKTTNFAFSNIVISNSEVSLFMIDKVGGIPQSPKTFAISNLEYSNSTFSDSNNIIAFKGMELNIDFKITLSNIKFNSITFQTTGNLILFQQQLKNPLIVSNLIITNMVNAYIQIEALNSHDTQFPTSIQISNMTASSVNAGFRSFIIVMENSILNVADSSIQNVFSFDNGAVIRSYSKNSQVSFTNTIFKYNSAIQGGVALVEDNGVINFTNCTLSNNFAVQSGIIQAQNNGAFNFYSSAITSNYAWSLSIGQCFDVISTSLFSSSTISGNSNYDKTTIIKYITNSTNCGTLCWINTLYTNYLTNNINLMSTDPSLYAIQLISSSCQISEQSTISNQIYFIDTFLSTIKILNSTIKDTLLLETGINTSASNITISNMTISGITTKSSTNSLIQAAFNSNLTMLYNSYTSSGAPLLTLIGSTCTIINLNSSNLSISSHFTKFQQVTNATLIDWNLKNVSISTYFSLYFTDSYIHLMENINFNTVNVIPIKLITTKVRLINNMTVYKPSSNPLSLSESQVYIQNSRFDSCGLSRPLYGTINSFKSNITVVNTIFIGNKAVTGAGIQARCLLSLPCFTILQNIVFQNNIASQNGGAIYYDQYRPEMTNVTFINNTAPSGPDISSYPVKVVLTGTNSSFINLTNVASGQTQNVNLKFSVVDYDNQLSTTTSGGRIIISSAVSNSSVLGISSAGIVNGSATFTSLIFVANPGSINVPFKISSNAIDSSTLFKQFGKYSIQDPMVVSFRFCKPGEHFDGQQCKVCTPGTYSLSWNSTECKSCPNNADCLGGVQIYVNSGYWRKSTNSTYMSECPRQNSCLGEYHPENEYPVTCEEGYTGILCTECTVVGGSKYERQSNFECEKCPNLVYNALRIMGLILLVSIFFIILIIVNIRKKKESQQSILLRILANYLQLLSVSMSFNMKFPPILVQIFYPLQKVGASSEAFLSLDCFFRDASIKGFTPSTALFKIFLTGMLPIFLICVALICWGLLYIMFKKWFKDFRRNVVVTIIVIIYLLHPTITKVSFEVFQCIRIDETEYRVKLDLDIVCFSLEHIKWCFILGFPMIVFWVVGCPVAVAIILFKNKKSLNDSKMQKYLLLLYQGLKEKCFYWELVNTLRKILMVAINVLLSTIPLIFSATTAVLVLIALIRIQIRLKPYKNELNNELEIESMVTGTATLFCGVLFISDDNRFAFIVLAILIVIIIINVKFLLHWCFCMSYTFIEKYKIFHSIFVILGIILMKKNLANKMIDDAGLGQTKKQKNKKISKHSEAKKKEPRGLSNKKRFFGKQRKERKNHRGVKGNDAFHKIKDNFFHKLPEESKASSEFSRFGSMADDTIVIESDKSSTFSILKIPYDSVQSPGITQNNKQKMEEKQIDNSSKVENVFNLEKIYKVSTFATKQQYDSRGNKKEKKLRFCNKIDSSILEKESEQESFE